MIAWLQKWWRWCLAGLATAAAFIAYVVWRRDEPPAPKPEVDREREERERAERAVKEAEARAAQDEAAAKAEAERAWSVVVDHAEETAELTNDNPEATDRFLDHVGDEMRRR